MNHDISIRLALPQDMESVHALVRELAEFEKAPEAVWTDAEQFRQDSGAASPWFDCLVAEHPEAGIVGIALCYRAYSTWKGKMIYLDDLVVTEAFRRQGIGKRLLEAVIDFARQTGAKQVKWQVLHWNEPAIEMYRQMGAEFDEEWIDCKILL